jgi:hypothetical protein
MINDAVRLKLRRTPDGVAVKVSYVGIPTHSVGQKAEFGIAAS